MSKRHATKSPTKRRARGTGSLFFDERRNLWVGRIPLPGRRSKSGRLTYQECSAPTQAGLLAKLKLLEPPGADTTVENWSRRWLQLVAVRDSTRDTYRFAVEKYIIPTLGTIRLAALTTGHCDSAVRQWLTRAAPGTVRVYLGQLRNCLNAARRAGAITANPASAVRAPKPPRRKPVEFPPSDLTRILEAALERTSTLPIAILAATGCRVGEALALDVDDVDARTGVIQITRTWTRRHGFRPPKSEEGNRTIRVPEHARPALVRAIGTRTSGPVFTTWTGRKRTYHESVRSGFARLLARLGLPRRNLHKLRAMVATALNAAGMPIADAAAYLGHTPEVYVATYLRPTGADPSRALDVLFAAKSPRKRSGRVS